MTTPRLATWFERAYCARAAAHLLREREARYPALIEAGKLSADDAAQGLARARAVVAQWRWAMDPAGSIDVAWDDERGVRGFGAYNFELTAEMTSAAARARGIAQRSPDNRDAAELADLYDALAWWQQDLPGSSTARIVMATSVRRRSAARAAEPVRAAA